MKVRVYVTDADIKAGCKFDATNCPIARALTRKIGEVCSVASTRWRVYNNGKNEVYQKLPDSACVFIRKFDDKGPFDKPLKRFNFTVDLPL